MMTIILRPRTVRHRPPPAPALAPLDVGNDKARACPRMPHCAPVRVGGSIITHRAIYDFYRRSRKRLRGELDSATHSDMQIRPSAWLIKDLVLRPLDFQPRRVTFGPTPKNENENENEIRSESDLNLRLVLCAMCYVLCAMCAPAPMFDATTCTSATALRQKRWRR